MAAFRDSSQPTLLHSTGTVDAASRGDGWEGVHGVGSCRTVRGCGWQAGALDSSGPGKDSALGERSVLLAACQCHAWGTE